MPLTAAICSIPVFAALLLLPVAGVVLSTGPTGRDAYAMLGGIVASILTLVEARKKDRGMGHTASVFLGSGFVGSMLPGALVYAARVKGWLTKEAAEEIAWQVWVVAGAVCGMNAWWLLHGVNQWLQRRAEKFFNDQS